MASMILIHRLTPFLIALVCAAGFACALLFGFYPIASLALSLLLIFLLLARLVAWQVRSFQFWSFVGTPFLLLASADAALLFFDAGPERLILAAGMTLLVFLFSENLFAYTHLPAAYQPFAIEHLSLGMNVLSVFFSAVAGFASRLFLQTSMPSRSEEHT